MNESISPSADRAPSSGVDAGVEADLTPTLPSEAEWLETNGLGGFAAGTVSLQPARRYHGLLIAPCGEQARRHHFLAGMQETIDGRAATELPARFELAPWPRWTLEDVALRREVLMPHGRNAVLVRYTHLQPQDGAQDGAPGGSVSDAPLRLTLRPQLTFRDADKITIHNDVLQPDAWAFERGIRVRPYDTLPEMTIALDGAPYRFEPDPKWMHGIEYETDLARGFEGREDHFCPGAFEVVLAPGASLLVTAWIGREVAWPERLWEAEAQRRESASPQPAAAGLRARLDRAADDFLYRTADGRAGVLAGFPWFGEWGRDTFIALPGLTLARGDLAGCADVLAGALPYLRDGLLPNIYGAGVEDSHYGSVDAALWFARAVLLYERAGGRKQRIRKEFLPALKAIEAGYRAGIPELDVLVDEDGLVHAGNADLNPTWMDAVAADEAVTPRHGCAVEISALYYSLVAHLAELTNDEAMRARLKRMRRAFLKRFWLEDEGTLADVWRAGEVDASVRPNMVLAAALEFSPLSRNKRKRVLARVEQDLLTPVGLRTLAPDHPDYEPRYEGGPVERDRAYHQGTVWPWLLGFYCEASLRADDTRRNRKRLRALLEEFTPELDRGGLDHIAEVYDGDLPRRGAGTFAQAWNTAEILRALALVGDDE